MTEIVTDRPQKRLHQYMYQEYYWNDITDKQRETNRVHNGEFFRYAITALRQILNASRTLSRFPPPIIHVPWRHRLDHLRMACRRQAAGCERDDASVCGLGPLGPVDERQERGHAAAWVVGTSDIW